MILFELFFTFMKLGFFNFGGGYTMVPLLQQEVVGRGWITAKDFADMLAISQMTPGPMAINLATFSGYTSAGFLGSLLATLGVFLPALILSILAMHLLMNHRDHPLVEGVLAGIRPASLGLVFAAFFFLAELSIFPGGIPGLHLGIRGWTLSLEGLVVDPGALFIFAAVLLAGSVFKIDSLILVLLSGLAGFFLC